MTRKNLFIASIAFLGGLSACKEKGPLIDLGKHTAKDSTYIAATETPQQRIVLVEDFTGASCSNCPAAHVVLNAIDAQHSGRLAIMGLHILNFNQAFPYDSPDGSHKHAYDFRTTEATDIGNSIYGGISLMPVAGINRVANANNGANPPNNNLFGSGVWSQMISDYLDSIPPVNLTVTSSLNTTGDTAYIVVKAAYTSTVSTKNVLSVAITESKLLDLQEDPAASNGEYDIDYEFNDVLRGFVSATTGSPMLDSLSSKAPGRVFTRSFLYKVGPTWKPENCRVVAFISNAEPGDKHVLQAAVAKLKP